MIHSFQEFLSENQSEIYTTDEVIDYITEITPNDSDVPDYSFKLMKQSNKKFTRKKVLIQDLLDSDESLRDYVMGGDKRYGENGESTYEPHHDDLFFPIVIFNDEVIDGYNRTSVHYHNGDKFIEAYVSN